MIKFRIIGINFLVILIIFSVLEIVSRSIYKRPKNVNFILSKPLPFKNDNSFEKIKKYYDGSCMSKKPILFFSNGFPRFSSDWSCGGMTFRNGIRITLPAHKGKPLQRIFVLGGSAVLGEGSIDQNTIPSYIQKKINGKGISKYKVFNLGFGSVVAKQQLTRLKEEKMQKDDIVIFYDGGNDFWQGVFYGNPYGTIIGYNKSHRWNIWKQNFKYWLSQNIRLYTFLANLKASADISSNGSCNLSRTQVVENAKRSSKIYIDYIIKSKRYVESSGGKFFHFFQPILFSKKELSIYEKVLSKSVYCFKEAVDAMAIYKEEYEKVAEKNSMFFDLSEFLANKNVFYDYIHISAKGNNLVANEILQKIPEFSSSQ